MNDVEIWRKMSTFHGIKIQLLVHCISLSGRSLMLKDTGHRDHQFNHGHWLRMPVKFATCVLLNIGINCRVIVDRWIIGSGFGPGAGREYRAGEPFLSAGGDWSRLTQQITAAQDSLVCAVLRNAFHFGAFYFLRPRNRHSLNSSARLLQLHT